MDNRLDAYLTAVTLFLDQMAYCASLLTNLSEISQLGEEWDALNQQCSGSLFSTHHWTMEWLKHFADLYDVNILAVHDTGRLVALAPFVISRRRSLGLPVNTMTMAGWAGSTLEMYETGIMHARNEASVVSAVIEGVEGMGWNQLRLNGLPDCPFHAALLQGLADSWRTVKAERIPCPYLNLEGREDVTETFSTRNRRTTRKLMRELSEQGRLDFERITDPQGAEDAMQVYADHHIKRWGSKGGSIFSDGRQRSFLISSAHMAAERGEGCVYEAHIDGQVASQALCLFDRDLVRVVRLGTNDDFLEQSPGFLLFAHMLRQFKEQHRPRVDLGAGAEDFKYRLGCTDRFVLGVRAQRGLVRAASELGHTPLVGAVLKKTGLKERMLQGL
jgi:CelD/BcsL family acetyltransferase involved in cellulose biosynthesis